MPLTVELSDETVAIVEHYCIKFVDNINSAIKKMHDLAQLNDIVDRPIASPGTSETAEADGFHQLPQKAFRNPVLEALYELGGRAHVDDVKISVYDKVASVLGSGDRRELTAGSARWWNAAQWSMNDLKNEGLIKKDSPNAIWELGDEGVIIAESLLRSRQTDEYDYLSHPSSARATETATAYADTAERQDIKPRMFDPGAVPDLTHTKLVSAKVDGKIVDPRWVGLMFHLIRLVPKEMLNSDQASKLVLANLVPGQKEDDGYIYLPEFGVSVQSQGANRSWRNVSHLAKQLGVSVEIEFIWRMKPNAAFPGITGCLSI